MASSVPWYLFPTFPLSVVFGAALLLWARRLALLYLAARGRLGMGPRFSEEQTTAWYRVFGGVLLVFALLQATVWR